MDTIIFHCGKDRRIKVKNIKVMINHTYDKYGLDHDQKYVEFTVIGKQIEYQDYMLLEEFKNFNPEIPIDQFVTVNGSSK